MLNVAVIAGSLRKDSLNKKLAHALDRLEHSDAQFSHINIDDIPLYNQDFDTNLPAPVVRMKNEISAAHAVLFVTPEYNRSVPGVLKNVIDWGTRPYGKNVWAKKPLAAIGTSPGVIGTAVAQAHLKSIMVSVGAIMSGQPEVYLVYRDGLIDDNFEITVPETRKFLQEFLDQFLADVRKISG